MSTNTMSSTVLAHHINYHIQFHHQDTKDVLFLCLLCTMVKTRHDSISYKNPRLVSIKEVI